MSTLPQMTTQKARKLGLSWRDYKPIYKRYPEGIEFNDSRGREIYVGCLVMAEGELECAARPQAQRIEDANKWNWLKPEQKERYIAEQYIPYGPGIVVSISDFDSDVDDEGRSFVGINPKIKVYWLDSGDTEDFETTIGRWGWSEYGHEPEQMDVDDIVNFADVVRDYSNVRGAVRIAYGGFTRAIGDEGFAVMPENDPDSVDVLNLHVDWLFGLA